MFGSTRGGAPRVVLGGDTLAEHSGILDVKFNSGSFSPWSNLFVRIEGRWMAMYKRDGDAARVAAIELGPGVHVTDLNDHDSATRFPRRFDVHCTGGLISATEFIFRTKSRKERDKWVAAIATNIHILDGIGLDPMFGLQDLDLVLRHMKDGLTLTPIRIRSSLVVRCATGEDIVTFLVASGLAKDRGHGTLLCRRLLSLNAIHHVIWEKDFTDSNEHYALCEADDDATHVIEHFQKYMDSRRFWKFFDDENGSYARSDRIARSTSSGGSGSASVSVRTSITMSQSNGSDAAVRRDGSMPVTMAMTGANMQPQQAPLVEKKAKKCNVCGKSFNPLRRRYTCHRCGSMICSHCSISRRNESDSTQRICTTCKLGEMSAGGQEFFDRVFSSSSMDENSSENGGMARSNSFEQHATPAQMSTDKRTGSGNNIAPFGAPRRKSSNVSQVSTSSSRHESFSSANGPDCPLCGNDVCAPMRDVYELSYPVVDPSEKDEFLTAEPLEKEADRLKSVKALIRALDKKNLAGAIAPMCSMTSIATSCPIVVVGLLDSTEYVLCGQHGVKSPPIISRAVSLASHTCRKGAPLVCSDLSHDIRFAGNPWRRDTLRAAFYAGIPVRLANGHIVGAIEVFDVVTRVRCVEVLNQMQTIVRGVQRKFDEMLLQTTKAAEPRAERRTDRINGAPVPVQRHATQERTPETASAIDIVEVKPSHVAPSPHPVVTKERTTPKAAPPPPPQSAPAPAPVAMPAPAAAPATPASAPATATAAASADADGKDAMSQGDMEAKLLQLLSQTTSTQEQLRNQQGQMVMAISSHSQQISQLAKQLERMENTLASKLDSREERASDPAT